MTQAKIYFLKLSNSVEADGPFSLNELLEKEVGLDSPVYTSSSGEWRMASDIEEIRTALELKRNDDAEAVGQSEAVPEKGPQTALVQEEKSAISAVRNEQAAVSEQEKVVEEPLESEKKKDVVELNPAPSFETQDPELRDYSELANRLSKSGWFSNIWSYRGQYLSGNDYFFRQFIGSFFLVVGVGFWVVGVTDYSRMRSLGHSKGVSMLVTLIFPVGWILTTIGQTSDPLVPYTPLGILGFALTVPLHLYMWFSNSKHVTKGSPMAFLRHHEIKHAFELQSFELLLRRSKEVKSQLGLSDDVLMLPQKLKSVSNLAQNRTLDGHLKMAFFDTINGKPVSPEALDEDKFLRLSLKKTKQSEKWLGELQDLFHIPADLRQ